VTGEALLSLTDGLVVGEGPDDEGLVARAGDDGVGILGGRGDGSDPTVVTLKGTSVVQLGHALAPFTPANFLHISRAVSVGFAT